MRFSHVHDDNLLRKMVWCILKATCEDIPQLLRENNWDICNGLGHTRSNYICTRLRRYIESQDINIVIFRRSSWQGCIVVDRANKNAYTIITKSSLQSLLLTAPQHPNRHYLQILLRVENGDLPAAQVSFWDQDLPDDDELLPEFKSIVQGVIDPAEGYRHFVIEYSPAHGHIKDINLLLYNGNLEFVDRESLMRFVDPDSGALTAPDNGPNDPPPSTDQADEDSKTLPKLKPGLKPKLRDIPEQA